MPLKTLGWCLCVAFAALLLYVVVFVVGPTIPNGFGFDSRAYWGFPRDPIYAGPGTANGYTIYRYSPAFIPLLQLFTLIPWPVFAIAWAAAMFGVYLWLAGRSWLPLLCFPPIIFELYMGNIHLLIAAAIVLGFRWPATWAFLLLTKVTPGVGLLWFAVRREWRSLLVALGATAAVAGLGIVLAPDAWSDWLRSLQETQPSIGPNFVAVPLVARLAAAAAIVTWGALTDRRWTVVVAATLGLPTLWTHGLAILVAISALRRGMPERLPAVSRLPRWISWRVAAPSAS
ncbi:MAG: alpha,2-mannosyltransferase [Chloroflexota bacterium]|jgi:hypothetical protein|nr:alpha,2-mannosyltransferase [Chloroflexota bacterium]